MNETGTRGRGKVKIRIGSRDSRLAILQSQLVMAAIGAVAPEVELELVAMKTTGDLILDKSLDKIGGKGLFVKELDRALLEGKIDLAVHSLKDMPMEGNPQLPILAVSQREDPRDGLVLPQTHQVLGQGALGCSSARRRLFCRSLFPGVAVENVRGNVLTRLNKLDEGQYAGLILACAGLKRLGLARRISRCFSPEEMIPAAGQGILAIQGRAGGEYDFLQQINHGESAIAAAAERQFVRTLEGDCSAPIGAFAQVRGRKVLLRALYFDQVSQRQVMGSLAGACEEAQRLGERLALQLQKEARA